MTDLDPLVRRTLPPPSGRPPQPPFVPAARSAARSATPQPTRAAPRTTRPRRRHPATGGRIIAAGLGASTMFGLIAVMGVAQAAMSSTTSTPAIDSPVTLTPVPTIATAPTIAPVVARADPSIGAVPAPTVAAPIVLQARPDVQVLTPAPAQSAPAPIATTSGSG